MPDTETYELSTIKDIFDKVPIERVELLFKELHVLMTQAAFVRGAADSLTDAKAAVIFPESITWLDDGKGEVETRFGAENSDDDFLTFKATLGTK